MQDCLRGQLDYVWRDLVAWAATFCREQVGCGAPVRKRCGSGPCMCVRCWYASLDLREVESYFCSPCRGGSANDNCGRNGCSRVQFRVVVEVYLVTGLKRVQLEHAGATIAVMLLLVRITDLPNVWF